MRSANTGHILIFGKLTLVSKCGDFYVTAFLTLMIYSSIFVGVSYKHTLSPVNQCICKSILFSNMWSWEHRFSWALFEGCRSSCQAKFTLNKLHQSGDWDGVGSWWWRWAASAVAEIIWNCWRKSCLLKLFPLFSTIVLLSFAFLLNNEL